MSPDKQAIAEKICMVLKKLEVEEELISLVEKSIMGKSGESEEVDEEDDGSMEPGKVQKNATVVVVKKNDSGRQSMTDMLKGF